MYKIPRNKKKEEEEEEEDLAHFLILFGEIH